MSATGSIGTNTNAIVTRMRKKRDLETTMTTLKQLLEPSLKKGSRKKNKPRSIAKKVLPPKPANRFDNIDDGEYYPNKLKRKVRLKKTVLRPKQEMKVVVATNKRKRCTPHKGINLSVVLTDCEQVKTKDKINPISKIDIKNQNASSNTSIHSALHVQTTPNSPNIHTELNVHTSINESSMYKLLSPPHKSLTQLTVDDLIRMDEDSLSGEDMMEILTCPSPVWWEDPADVAQGTVYLTQASEFTTPVIEHYEENTRQESAGVKRGSVSVSASKARKIAKLENILGHIKSLVGADVSGESLKNIDNNKISNRDNDDDNDSVSKVSKNDPSVILEVKTESVNEPEVNETNRKRRHISSSGSEISVNEDELLRNLENIDIPIEYQKDDKDSPNISDKEDITKNCNDVIPIDNVEETDDLSGNEEPKTETVATQKAKRQKRSRKILVKKKIESPKKQIKGTQYGNKNDSNKEDTKNKGSKNDADEKPAEPDKSVLRRLDSQNDDILDVKLIKVPTNITNEVKVWSKLENFKRHNFKPSDFQRNATDIEDEYEIPISTKRNNPKEQDPLEINNETILIDDDSNDFDVDTGIDVVNINVVEHVTISPVTDDTSCNSEIIELDSAKEIIEDREEIANKNEEKSDKREERNIIKEDTIRIGNDLDIKLIETSDVQDAKTKQIPEQNVEISKRAVILPKGTTESIELTASFETKSDWHVNKYLKFDNKTNDRGIFRVDDPDDATDTILCLNDVDVSLVKNPRLKEHDTTNTVNVDESINDLSITLVSKCDEGVTITPIVLPKQTESPKSIKSTSESAVENSDTISDTNIEFLDEYEVETVHRNIDKNNAIDKTIEIDSDINKTENISHLELDQDIVDIVCITSEANKTTIDDESTDYEDNENIDEEKQKI